MPMPQILLIISYVLDAFILILLITLIIGLVKLIKALGKYNLADHFKITPAILFKHPSHSFKKYAKTNQTGTHLLSYAQHKELNLFLQKLFHSTLLILAVKILIIGLSLNIAREGAAQLKVYDAIFQTKEFQSFSKGKFTMTEWDNNSVTLQAGQLSGNYISEPFGSGLADNEWKNLSWEMDNAYDQRPAFPKETIAVWDLDALDKCTSQAYAKYKCQANSVEQMPGIYNSSSYNFDGFKSKVKIAQNLTFSGSFTVGAWIKPRVTILNGSEDQNFAILSKSYGDYTAKPPYIFRENLYFGFRNGALSLIFWSDENQKHWVKAQNTKFSFEPGLWYFVTAVYNDKDKTLKIYINGIEQTNLMADYDEGAINHAPNLSRDNFPSWLGSAGYRWQDGEEKIINVFDGQLDEIFLVNSAMSILDIRNLVNKAGEIKFQVRSGNLLPLSNDFAGPNNDRSAYFTNSKTNDLSFLGSSKYLQYIAYISRPNTNFEPKLSGVKLDYSTADTSDTSDVKISLQADSGSQMAAGRDLNKEKQAIDIYIKIFKKMPSTALDWQFVNITAYNKVEKRDLSKEVSAVVNFIKINKKLPKSDLDWGLVKALAYTEKGKLFMAGLPKK